LSSSEQLIKGEEKALEEARFIEWKLQYQSGLIIIIMLNDNDD
jgi:hypothetical protein